MDIKGKFSAIYSWKKKCASFVPKFPQFLKLKLLPKTLIIIKTHRTPERKLLTIVNRLRIEN